MDALAVKYDSGAGNPILQTDLKSGMSCVARYSEDNTVYRAIIQSVGENTATVFFCDYGNKEDVVLHDIKEIDSDCMQHPMQGIKCKLFASKPQQLTWTSEEIDHFFSLTEEKEFTVQFVNKNSGIYEVVMVDTKSKSNINEKFGAGAGEINASLSSKSTQEVSNIANECVTFAEADQRFHVDPLPPEFNNNVSITWFVNPEKFYCQLLSSKLDLNNMMNAIQIACRGRDTIKSPLHIGSPVIAKFKSDGVLYRAEVQSIPELASYVVQFVDYGNCELVDKFSLWKIESRFMNLPKQAHLCSVQGVKPLDSEWRRQDKIDKCFQAEEFNCTFHSSKDGINLVTLTTLEGKNVADELISCGFAVSSKIPQATTTSKYQNYLIN